MVSLASLMVPAWFLEAKKAGLSKAEIMKKMEAYGQEIAALRTGENAGIVPEGWAESMYRLYSEHYEQGGS